MKLANWTHTAAADLKAALAEFGRDMQDPVNVAILALAVIVLVGLLMGSIFG